MWALSKFMDKKTHTITLRQHLKNVRSGKFDEVPSRRPFRVGDLVAIKTDNLAYVLYKVSTTYLLVGFDKAGGKKIRKTVKRQNARLVQDYMDYLAQQ